MAFPQRVIFFGILVCVIPVPIVSAAPITSGNILISTSKVLYEYTPAGVFVQSFPIPYPTGPYPPTEYARDIAVRTGDPGVHVYNGTFDPYLSTLDTTTSMWSHETFAGWSTVNNGSYGGIAVGGAYVFVTDMDTVGAAEKGVLRFDSGGSTIRFATGVDPIDLNMGLNGLLYVLDGRYIYVYDPETFVLLQTIDLFTKIMPADYRSIAANRSGQIFVADWDGNVYKTDFLGNSIASINLTGVATSNDLIDIDISGSRVVVVGDRGGGVTVMDESFSAPTSFSVGSLGIFVAMDANPPIGVPISPFAVGILALFLPVAGYVVLRRMERDRVY